MSKSYSQKLKDPRWQERRKKILERDNYKCQFCFSDDKVLDVHHIKYQGEPWEASNASLITLCRDCHEGWHDNYPQRTLVKVCVKLMKDNNIKDLGELNMVVCGIGMDKRVEISLED